MKTLIIFTLAALTMTSVWGQKIIDKSLSYSKGQKIDLNLKFGETIQLKGWDKNEVGVKISVNINNNRLNDAFLVNFNSESDYIKVSSDFDEELLKNAQCGDCPDGKGSYWGNKQICADIKYEIYLPSTAQVKVETISANMEISGMEGPMVAKSISGFIDMSISPGRQSDVFMKTISGECYSDLNIAYNEGGAKDWPGVGVRIQGKINGGGSLLELETISSNIYLRKKAKG